MDWPRSLQLSEQGLEIIKNNIARIKKNNPSWNNLDWLEKATNHIDNKARVSSVSTLKRFKGKKPIEVKGYIALCEAIDIDWRKVTDWKSLGIDEEDFISNPWKNTLLEDEYTLTGHANSVGSIALSPNGTTLASGSYDGEIKIWDLQKRKVKCSLKAHEKDVSCLVFSSEKELISGSYDEKIKIWNLQMQEVKWTLHQEELGSNPYAIESMSLSPNGEYLFINSYESEQIRIWYLPKDRKLVGSLSKHKDGVMCLAMSPNSPVLVSGGKDGKVYFWAVPSKDNQPHQYYEDWKSFPESESLEQHSDWVTSLAISPNNEVVASGGKDGEIYLWNLNSGTFIKKLEKHSKAVLSLAFSPDSQTLASASYSQTIKIHNWRESNVIQTLETYPNYTQCLVFSQHSQRLFSSNSQGNICTWKPSSINQ